MQLTINMNTKHRKYAILPCSVTERQVSKKETATNANQLRPVCNRGIYLQTFLEKIHWLVTSAGRPIYQRE